MVALIIELKRNPSPILIERTPFASPRCFPGNQIVDARIRAGEVIIWRRPKRNIVAERVTKLSDIPRRIPANPVRKHPTTRTRFVPKRSLKYPPRSITNMPESGIILQIIPTWTRSSPRSVDISLKRTGIHICGIATKTQPVRAIIASILHLDFKDVFSSITIFIGK
jgi:hypothetical protein